MQIISTTQTLENKFQKLIENCDSVSFLSAWATNANPLSNAFQANAHKFDQIVVGLKFYQTDPKFLKRYAKNKSVKFVKNDTSGVFHPKVYLFETSNEWHLFIGSSNFTKQGFGSNFEVTTYHKSNDFEDKNYWTIKNLIAEKWKEAAYLTQQEIEDYAAMHAIQQPKIESLSGNYGKKTRGKSKPNFSIPILNWTWKEFMTNIKDSEYKETTRGRIELLDAARKYFMKSGELLSMSINQRREIGGLGSEKGLQYGSFGTMGARGYFTSYMLNIQDHPLLSESLNHIPLLGEVSKTDFLNFVEKYDKVFSGTKEIAGATRLLTTKRPDIFVNFNGANKENLCREFGIAKNISYEEYWDAIIARIKDAVWWNQPNPKNKFEKAIADKRAAFLDSIFYE